MRKQKRFLAMVVLYLAALSVDGRPADSARDTGARPRLRDRIIRIVRVITNGDSLTPPFPSPKP